jgi:hypothetical protein
MIRFKIIKWFKVRISITLYVKTSFANTIRFYHNYFVSRQILSFNRYYLSYLMSWSPCVLHGCILLGVFYVVRCLLCLSHFLAFFLFESFYGDLHYPSFVAFLTLTLNTPLIHASFTYSKWNMDDLYGLKFHCHMYIIIKLQDVRVRVRLDFGEKCTRACDVRAAEIEVCEFACARPRNLSQLTLC